MDNRLISKYKYIYTLALRGFKPISKGIHTTPYLKEKNIPSSLNWTSKGAVTSVKNQLIGCRSDWAYAAVAYAESKLIIDGLSNADIDLSEQRLLQCTVDSSCSGGYLERAMDSVINGIPSENIPYSGLGLCKSPGIKIASKV